MQVPLKRIAAPALALCLLQCDGSSTSPAVPPTLDLVLRGCPSQPPSFLAVLNEGGQWTAVAPGSGEIITIKVTNKVGLAITDDFFGSPLTVVMYGSAAELNAVFGSPSCPSSGSKTLSGTVSALSSSQTAFVWLGSAFDFAYGPSSLQSYTLSSVKNGPLDLIAMRQGSGIIEKVIVRRQLDLANGSSIPLLDFAAAEAATGATGSLTVTGLGAEETGVTSTSLDFRSAGGTELSLFGPPTALKGVPSNLTQAGDVHILTTTLGPGLGPISRRVTQFHRDLGNHVAAFGPPLNAPTVSTRASTPSLRMRAQLASQAEYGGSALAWFGQEGATFLVAVSSSFLGGTPTEWNLEMPELSAVPGFPQNAKLVNGITTGWSVESSSATLAGLNQSVGSDGTVIKSARKDSPPSSGAIAVQNSIRQVLRRAMSLRTQPQ